MAMKTVVCVEALCDVCDCGQGDEGNAHFRAEAEALQWLLSCGWHQLPDGRLVCNNADDRHEEIRIAHGISEPGIEVECNGVSYKLPDVCPVHQDWANRCPGGSHEQPAGGEA
ncbi:hypothetical protein [Streptomyces xanthochromogenes]|uniref:hypothetical protein n=1 Tax=Streptomyces xanthochromogenes TaxID=67384 RepID=UPI002F406884